MRARRSMTTVHKLLVHAYPGGWSPYSRTRIRVSIGTTHVWVSGWIWVKIKMMDLWMQIEGTKLIFIINSVLDFFKFASRMPQIAQILVSTFKIFPGGHAPGPPWKFPLFFSLSSSRLWNMEFLQLSEITRACEIDAELKKNKWRNEWLDPTRAWIAPGPLLDIFLLFFSKTKIFHSHPCHSPPNSFQRRVETEVKSVHTCIPSHGLRRSWYSGNKNTPSVHHPWRWNVTTAMVGF